ncbi:MAG: tetratricopeptide repeat protein [Planctomycetota bacterium]
MTNHKLARSFELFDQLAELDEQERGRVLEDLRASEPPTVIAQLESMLDADRAHDIDDRLEPGHGAGVLAAGLWQGGGSALTRVGTYRIVGELGRGGMGIVYEAEQEKPRRTVALKVLSDAGNLRGLARRFEREAEFLGRLQHRGIAQVYEAGTARAEDNSGRATDVSFFAMELIRGKRIDAYCDEHSVDRSARLELFAKVCDAVQHAHEMGVIHRDLKPDNIFVDDDGEPKVLDFGIARITDSDVQATTVQTEVGQILGTVAYMSPEQVAGNPAAIDGRTDVYSLGVILFRLISGRMPLDITGKPIVEAARIVQHDEPTSLSTIDRSLRGDIETIALTALDKERDRRYQDPAALAADVRRFLNDEPLTARPASTLYQLKKFTRRNRALVGGVVASVTVLVAGVIGTSVALAWALRANTDLEATNESLALANVNLEQANTDLRRVSEFQASQLAGLDVAAMGATFRSHLLESRGEAGREALDAALGDANFTTATVATLDEHILDRSRQTIDDRFTDDPEVRGLLLHTLAGTMQDLGSPQSALSVAQAALDVRRASRGADHEDTLLSAALVGQAHLSLGQLDEADAAFSDVIQSWEKAAGPADSRVLNARARLIEVLLRRQDGAAAEQLARELIDRMADTDDSSDSQLVGVREQLASALSDQGKYDEAIAIHRDVVAHHTERQGESGSATLTAKLNYATTLGLAGKVQDAGTLEQEVLDARRATLGDDHPQTILAMDVLTQTLTFLGDLDEAEKLAREAYDRGTHILGPNHPDTLGALNSLASATDRLGRFKEAEVLYRRSLEGHRLSLGEDHPRTIIAGSNVGFILQALDQPEAAEPFYKNTYERFLDIYGDRHPSTLTALGNYANVLRGLGQTSEALALFRISYQTRLEAFGEDHPSTLLGLFNLANALTEADYLEEAEPLCIQALAKHEAILGEDHIGTLHCLRLLGTLRSKQGRQDEAIEFFRESLARRARALGPDHPLTQQATERLEEALASAEATGVQYDG